MYQWILAGHVIAIISWMAAMLYLPRLMVYHVGSEAGSSQSETFKVMERRLLKAIMTPSMIAAWVFGLTLAILGAHFSEAWFVIKFFLVVLMTAFHGFSAKWVKDFAKDENVRSEKFFRVVNEMPAVLMIFIVILVIVKPF